MADEPINLVLQRLIRLDQKIDALRLEFTDMRDSLHRIEADVGALRGSVSALRHDTSIYSTRWSDIEVRTRALEADD